MVLIFIILTFMLVRTDTESYKIAQYTKVIVH